VSHLIEDCDWPAKQIHVLGFGQGGTVAVEYGLHLWKARNELTGSGQAALGSIVTIGGPLISFPTSTTECPTAVLVVSRKEPSEFFVSADAKASLRRGYGSVEEIELESAGGMPQSRKEWEGLMRFWSVQLKRRQLAGVYELLSGQSS
jgi:hypothetical protein